jgi:excisionase family DNA binding protein
MENQTKSSPAAPVSEPAANQVLTINEACQQLRISRWSLYQLIQRRELATIQIGRRRLVPKTAITAFVEQRLEATT